MAPVLFLSFFAGAVADRNDRRKIIVITQWLEMLQAAVLAVLAITHLLTVPIIIILAVFLGVCSSFEMPARQSFVPSLVKEDELANAIGLNSALWNSSRVFGPALAGLTIGLFGAGTCFVLNAISFVAALVTLHMVTGRAKKPSSTSGSKSLSMQELWQALKKYNLVNILFLTAAVSIFGFQFSVLLPVIVGDVLHGQAAQLGWMTSAMGVGALVGSLAFAARTGNKSLRRPIGFATLALAAGIALMGWTTSMIVSLAAIAVAGAAISLTLGGANFTIQMSVPEELRGRVMGVYTFFMIGLAPVGALMAGWLASWLGISFALVFSAAACAVAAVFYLRRNATGS
jgi:MFS family permease